MNNNTAATLVIGLVTFLLGNVSGYFAHDFMKRTLAMNEDGSKNFLLVTVTIIWAISMLVGLVNPAYQVPLAVHGLMGAIVGFFFYRPKNGGS